MVRIFSSSRQKIREEAAAQIQTLYLRELQDTSIGQLQIISPYRTDGEASSNGLNALIRETVNPHTEKIPELVFGERIFRLHDRVMQTKNNYNLEGYDSACKQKFKGVFNGDIGSICKILPDKLCVDFDGRIVEYSKSAARRSGTGVCHYDPQIHGFGVRNGHYPHFDGAPYFADEESDLYCRDTRKKTCHSGWAEACAVSGDPLRQKGQTEHLPCRADLKSTIRYSDKRLCRRVRQSRN